MAELRFGPTAEMVTCDEMDKILMDDVEGDCVLVGFEESDETSYHETSYYDNALGSSILTKRRKEIKIESDKGKEMKELIKQQVLNFLPAKSVYRLRAVSKDWDSYLSGPFFAHQQSLSFNSISGLFAQLPGETPSFVSLDRSTYGVPVPSLSFLPEPVEVRATNNGGLLCCRSHVGTYYICNPVTKLWTKLPDPTLYHGPETVVGLTFEPSPCSFTSHYQLVCAVVSSFLDDYKPPIVSFEVFSSRSAEWRVCDNMSCSDLGAPEFVGDGFYLNGFVYWETGSGNVLAFDVKNEDFGVLTLPPNNGGTHGALSVMNGEVCYLLPIVEGVECRVEIYGNMDMRLMRVIRFTESKYNMSGEFRALAFANEKLLIVILGKKIMAFDVEVGEEKWIGNASNDGFEKYVPYVNSLVNVPPCFDMELLNEYN
ncbi:F-box protein At5g49610 [Linum perenne]